MRIIHPRSRLGRALLRSVSPAATSPQPVKPSRDIARLIEIMAALRTPGSGCPWDLEQTFRTIAPYTLEEAYEVADAIARGDLADLKDELGDLLLQVAFHARMAEEQGAFDFGDVVETVTAKLIAAIRMSLPMPRAAPPRRSRACGSASRPRRRPSAARRRRAAPGRGAGRPARVNPRPEAAGQGRPRRLRLERPRAVLAKIREEADEIEAELDGPTDRKAAAEVGDLLFAVVNLARHLGADPEDVLRQTNLKFERRFASIERAWPRAARRRRTPRWPRWMRCGTRPRRRRKSQASAEGKAPRL